MRRLGSDVDSSDALIALEMRSTASVLECSCNATKGLRAAMIGLCFRPARRIVYKDRPRKQRNAIGVTHAWKPPTGRNPSPAPPIDCDRRLVTTGRSPAREL